MHRFRFHVFVCENERKPDDPRGCCSARGSKKVREALKAEMARRGLHGLQRCNGAGCLDACEHGPSIVVYGDGQHPDVWYGHVTPEDVPELVEAHLLGGRPVERLLIQAFMDKSAAGRDPRE